MKVYEYNLYALPMKAFKDGVKKVEMRLYDEKRQQLRIGDYIRFSNIEDDKDTLTVRIIGLKRFQSFKEIYETYKPNELGYHENEKASYEDMYSYYPKEKIKRYGAFAIEIEIVKDIKYKEIKIKDKDYQEVIKLRDHFFPRAELINEEFLLAFIKEKHAHIIGAYYNNEFIGCALYSFYDEISYLMYFAIKDEYQNQGIGSRFLYHIADLNKDRKLFIDIELVDKKFIDYELREKRKEFYLRNGFKESDYRFSYNDVEYEVLSINNDIITGKEINKFWQSLFQLVKKSTK